MLVPVQNREYETGLCYVALEDNGVIHLLMKQLAESS